MAMLAQRSLRTGMRHPIVQDLSPAREFLSQITEDLNWQMQDLMQESSLRDGMRLRLEGMLQSLGETN